MTTTAHPYRRALHRIAHFPSGDEFRELDLELDLPPLASLSAVAEGLAAAGRPVTTRTLMELRGVPIAVAAAAVLDWHEGHPSTWRADEELAELLVCAQEMEWQLDGISSELEAAEVTLGAVRLAAAS